MPHRRTPRPLQSAPKPPRGHYARNDWSPQQKTPSVDFDWDTALYLNALTVKKLGYPLSEGQKKRIEDHDSSERQGR